MKKLVPLFTCILVSAFLISCQKENSNQNVDAGITGNYKFLSLKMDGVSTSSASAGTYTEKAVTASKYTTQNNAGTISFTPTTMSSQNLSYDIDTVIQVSFYVNNVLEQSMDMPFQFQIPPTSGTSSYKVITSDSLYFSEGSMFRDGSVTQPTEPSGAKIRKEGDKLFMTFRTNKTTTQNNQGTLVTTHFNGVGVISLQKL